MPKPEQHENVKESSLSLEAREAAQDAAHREAMSEDQIIAAIEAFESEADSVSADPGMLTEAYDYYTGAPNGAERPDRSSIVMLELFSTIEWVKPVLAKIFFSGKKIVEFTPKKQEDVASAEQETDYVNHVMLDQNRGFSVIMNWFTDAMISRNAYVFARWEEKTDTTETRIEGLTIEQVASLTGGDDVELTESTVADTVTVEGQPIEVYNIKFITTKKIGKIVVDNIPPERVKVAASHRHVSLRDTPFVEYHEKQSISALREMGHKISDTIADDHDTDQSESVDLHRGVGDTQGAMIDNGDSAKASRQVTVRHVFIRLDVDGDGLAELRYMMIVGKTVLINETNDMISIACLTPIELPHKHEGMSYHDIVKQIQDLKTSMARGLVDNTHLANNGRYFITSNVNIPDLLNGRPNAPVRVDGRSISDQAQPLNHPMLGPQIMNMLQYSDQLTENWTGASPRSLQGQNFDGNSINKTASGLSQIMSAALARIELVARMFAETGVQDLMMIIHALLRKHQKIAETYKLRNKWVSADPMNWETRTSMTVDTALGTGNQQERVANFQQLISAQMSYIAAGMTFVTPQNLYNANRDLAEEMGFMAVDEYYTDPSKSQQPGGLESLPPKQREVIMQQIAAAAKQQNDTARQQGMQQDRQLKAEADMRGISNEQFLATMQDRTKKEGMFLDAQVALATVAQQSDDTMVQQGAEIENEPEQTPVAETTPAQSKKRVVHKYDDAGRLVESELVTE